MIMIISASRRTDIPAFYMEWFMNRIREGFFCSRNPFNPSQTKCVSLEPKNVDTFVFWSKNPAPMLEHTDELDKMEYRYYLQYTLNDYPRLFEPGLPVLSERVDTFRRLSERIGSKRVVWRYDPVIVSNITPVDYHIDRFERLAKALSGYCSKVIISFVDNYGKVEKRWGKLEQSEGFKSVDLLMPENESSLNSIAGAFAKTAEACDMEIFSCCEQVDLSGYGIMHGSCIDAALISSIFGIALKAKKDRNQRNGCLCAESVDMGAYNCCGHFCAYCYANTGEASVKHNMAAHDTKSPFLLQIS